MKLHKNLLLLGASALLLGACGTDGGNTEDTEATEEPETEEVVENEEVISEENEPTQEEINSELKNEAEEIDFVTANGGDYEQGARVYAEGEISTVVDDVIDEFVISTVEGDGYGMYRVRSFNTTDAVYTDGDILRVYGSYDGKDENTGMPVISSTFVEKVSEADE